MTFDKASLETIEKWFESKKDNPVKPDVYQVDGKHYTDLVIQPHEYSYKNKLGWHEGETVKYVSRWRNKGGIRDLKKAIHILELLIYMEESREG